mmetsp:Transcript_630/g.1543  ORF Transcript_630/g.1543 Transcript_630/m.1543 type:complete len:446 (+) Transcript_630:339-1676(+)
MATLAFNPLLALDRHVLHLLQHRINVNSYRVLPARARAGLSLHAEGDPVLGSKVARLGAVVAVVEATVVCPWEVDDELPSPLGRPGERDARLGDDGWLNHVGLVPQKLLARARLLREVLAGESLELFAVRGWHCVPSLWRTKVKVVNAVQVHVLAVPREGSPVHADVQEGGVDARDLLLEPNCEQRGQLGEIPVPAHLRVAQAPMPILPEALGHRAVCTIHWGIEQHIPPKFALLLLESVVVEVLVCLWGEVLLLVGVLLEGSKRHLALHLVHVHVHPLPPDGVLLDGLLHFHPRLKALLASQECVHAIIVSAHLPALRRDHLAHAHVTHQLVQLGGVLVKVSELFRRRPEDRRVHDLPFLQAEARVLPHRGVGALRLPRPLALGRHPGLAHYAPQAPGPKAFFPRSALAVRSPPLGVGRLGCSSSGPRSRPSSSAVPAWLALGN